MKGISFLVLAALYTAVAQAQGDAGGSVDVNLKTDSGGVSTWMWVVGAIVFVLLLVALLRGRGGSDTVVEKRTVIKE